MKLIDIEKQFGIKFPQAYHSLSIPDEGACMIALDNVWHILGINDLPYYIKEAWESDGFPSSGIVVAYDGSGNYLFLLAKRDGPDLEPEVYLHDHETHQIIKISSGVADAMKEIHTKDKYSELLDGL